MTARRFFLVRSCDLKFGGKRVKMANAGILELAGLQMRRNVSPWLLRFFLCLIWLHLVFPLTEAQPEGFLSIDCGYADADYLDPTNFTNPQAVKPVWVADTNFTVVGAAGQISSNLTSVRKDLETLRYFNGSQSKSCYVLSVEVGKVYLIRAGFLYGNYDGLDMLPIFDLALDANLWATVTISNPDTPFYSESIFAPTASSISVCLIPSVSVPFINSLELRTLPNESYPLSAGNHLHILKRANFGGPEMRYPVDAYDRIWEEGDIALPELANLTSLSNFQFDSYSSFAAVPGAVLESAILAPSISFSYPAPSTPSNASLSFFFAELNNTDPSYYRLMTVEVGTVSQLVNLTATNGSRVLQLVQTVFNIPVTEGLINQTVTTSSNLGSLLNALEAFSIDPVLMGTSPNDGTTLSNITSYFPNRGWVGDPCLPVPWKEIACSPDTDLPKVVSLNLASKNLSGAIPNAIGELSSLSTLDMSNNDLSGEFPPWLVDLQNLTELSIENNNISGTVPPCLASKLGANFRYGGNPLLVNSTEPCEAPLIPVPSPAFPPASPLSSGSRVSIGVVVGAVIAALVVMSLVAAFFLWARKGKEPLSEGADVSLISSHREAQDQDRGAVSIGRGNRTLKLSENEIRVATANFTRNIAEGVFYGKLSEGNREVAVKTLPEASPQDMNFSDEVAALAGLQHKNLVALVGFCPEGGGLHQNMLVYEYMEGHDLHHRLHGPFTEHSLHLTWTERINIGLDIASGLDYLHSKSNLYLNFKSSSILLNRKTEAKLTNYRILKQTEGKGLSSNGLAEDVRGTPGYLDPESIVINEWTDKSDVYSFGVLLLELVCGRKPFSACPPYGAWLHIIDWVKQAQQGGQTEGIVDPAIGKTFNTLAFHTFLELAMTCTDSEISKRPSMKQVVRGLQNIILIDMERRAI